MQNPMNRLEECKKVPPVAGPVNVIDNSTIEDSKRKVLPAWLRLVKIDLKKACHDDKFVL